MQPETQKQKSSPEVVASMGAIDKLPELSGPALNGVEKSSEKYEQAAEANASLSDSTAMTTVIPTADNGAVAPITTPISDQQVITDTPQIAADDDLIEKEWVDRAKKIVEETPGDPHERDMRVSALKSDYVKKRYGRELGAA